MKIIKEKLHFEESLKQRLELKINKLRNSLIILILLILYDINLIAGFNTNEEALFVNKEKGITLVALIVTVIVLLILATVSVQVFTGNNRCTNKNRNSEE